MKTIGITGGIGSGKSTVTEYLKNKGYPVVDADLVARTIVEPGTIVLAQLVSYFGADILEADGSLNRKKMAELAFATPSNKEILDRITHGAILAAISEQIDKLKRDLNPSLIFVDAALLIETGLFQTMDEVWLVTAEEDLRIRRVVSRDQLDPEMVKQRIRLQMSDKQKSRHAFRLIQNSGTKEELYKTLEKILRDYETI
jgi:dephospho-CoA kinase